MALCVMSGLQMAVSGLGVIAAPLLVSDDASDNCPLCRRGCDCLPLAYHAPGQLKRPPYLFSVQVHFAAA